MKTAKLAEERASLAAGLEADARQLAALKDAAAAFGARADAATCAGGLGFWRVLEGSGGLAFVEDEMVASGGATDGYGPLQRPMNLPPTPHTNQTPPSALAEEMAAKAASLGNELKAAREELAAKRAAAKEAANQQRQHRHAQRGGGQAFLGRGAQLAALQRCSCAITHRRSASDLLRTRILPPSHSPQPPRPNYPLSPPLPPPPSVQRDHLSSKLADVEARLADAKADKRQSERDRRLAKAAADLKREIPGAGLWGEAGRVRVLRRVVGSVGSVAEGGHGSSSARFPALLPPTHPPPPPHPCPQA